VLLAVSSCFLVDEAPELSIDDSLEIIWVKLQLVGRKQLYFGSFYRPPNNDTDYLDLLQQSLAKIPPSATVILGGDFNCKDIDWKSNQIPLGPSINNRPSQQYILDITTGAGLHQLVDFPTRESSTLDLLFSNCPALISNTTSLAPIGNSDHSVVSFHLNLKASEKKTTPRPIFLFKKGNGERISADLLDLESRVTSLIEDNININEVWDTFKVSIQNTMAKNIPTKLIRPPSGYPWITQKIKQMLRKKERLFRRAQKTKDPLHKLAFTNFRKLTQKTVRNAYWSYLSNLFSPLDLADPSENYGITRQNNTKNFWTYIKNLKRECSGIPSLEVNSQPITSPKEKAEALNNQFTSVFTSEPPGPIPNLPNSTFPRMLDFTTTPDGIEKLLNKIDPRKAIGPDGIPTRFLKDHRSQLSSTLSKIFNYSLKTSSLPQDWKTANVPPVFKKGSRLNPANYRPISLTSISCKILEHIIVRNIMDHLEKNNILHPNQHGFRQKLSCEIQLTCLLDDLAKNISGGGQVDVIITDFAKAFDKVPHRRLIAKCKHYGLNNTTVQWVSAFLTNRTQRVVLEGEMSPTTPVLSGVPQGTCLGPVLFLIYINDLSNNMQSNVRLFADDCIIYNTIKTKDDCISLQNDLHSLETWVNTWLMELHPAKCSTMQITRKRPHNIIKHPYTIHGSILECTSSTKYLGITITDRLDWTPHIGKVTAKARSVLGLLCRNLRSCPEKTKELAYFSLVRPTLEYASSAWDPHQSGDKAALERVQRRAARFVKGNYDPRASVSNMISELGWPSLETRRRHSRLSYMYKYTHNLTRVDYTRHMELLPPSARHYSPLKIHKPYCSTNYLKFSFFPNTTNDWNALPTSARTLESIEQFKTFLNKAQPI
jgi:hypothetical protein